MKSLIGQIVGAWAAFATIALFVRVAAPKNTAITCAYCGTPVPMETAQAGGIGAVNLAMREHIEQCDGHPLKQARWELAQARSAMRAIHSECLRANHIGSPEGSDEAQFLHSALTRIADVAGRNF